jgi:transcriptional regulator with XRE-family HTH domain
MKTIVALGAEFQALRKDAGLTQEETARRVGMRQEALSRFERGRGSDFSVAKLLRLCQALGRDLDFAPVHKRTPTLDDVLAERRAGLGYGYSGYSPESSPSDKNNTSAPPVLRRTR